MFSIAIVAVLSTMVVPAMTDLFKNTRMTNAVNDFVAALQLARSEAIKRAQPITVVVAAATWNDGWDVNTAAPETLKAFKPLRSDMTMTSAGGYTSFTYDATGRIDNSDVLTWCDDRTGENGRTVTINATGRTSVDTVACP